MWKVHEEEADLKTGHQSREEAYEKKKKSDRKTKKNLFFVVVAIFTWT